MSNQPPAIVIVPSAQVGGWRWRAVADDLRARGHAGVHARLAGLGERAHLTSPAVNLSMHAQDIASLIFTRGSRTSFSSPHSWQDAGIEWRPSSCPRALSGRSSIWTPSSRRNGDALNDLVPGPPHLPEDPDDYLRSPPRAAAVGFNAHMTAEARRGLREAAHPAIDPIASRDKAQLAGARDGSRRKPMLSPRGTKRHLPAGGRKPRTRRLARGGDAQHARSAACAVKETADMIESAIPLKKRGDCRHYFPARTAARLMREEKEGEPANPPPRN